MASLEPRSTPNEPFSSTAAARSLALLPTTTSTPSPITSPRPRLLPQNRRLRHLTRITLHNLALSRPPPRPPARAADDHSLPQRPQQKQQQQQPSTLWPPHPGLHPGLQHSRSSENLPRVAAYDGATSEDGEGPSFDRSTADGRAKTMEGARLHPSQHAGPRRVGLGEPPTGPKQRQEALERAVDSRLADAFFSLHCFDGDDPVYISEVVERSMNFNFGVLDLSQHPPAVSRSSHLTVRVWTRKPRHGWSLLIEDTIDLRALAFLGTGPDPSLRLPPNTLLLHLVDGVYSFNVPPPRRPRPNHHHPTTPRDRSQTRNPVDPVPMASYNTLMKLCTLESSVQDVLLSREQVAAQVDAHLSQPPPTTPHLLLPLAQDALLRARTSVAHQRRALISAQKRRDALCESLRARRDAIRAGRDTAAQAASRMSAARDDLEHSRTQAAQTQDLIQAQRRRICNDLASVYPITPDPENPAPLAFRICGLPLPNTTYDAAAAKAVPEDVVSAALSLAARLTDQLQCYLAVPVPYPITSYGSRSVVRDDISLIPESLYASSRHSSHHLSSSSSSSFSSAAKHRDYPLYLPRGGSTAGQFRFDYAWFLLNKDVEALAAARGLRVVDIRHTLPNLKTLLYACGAGSELPFPERKRGGIRGLMGGGGNTGGGSRPGSADSDARSESHARRTNHLFDTDVTATTTNTNNSTPTKQNLLAPRSTTLLRGTHDDGMPAMMTLRTRGLRENVAASP